MARSVARLEAEEQGSTEWKVDLRAVRASTAIRAQVFLGWIAAQTRTGNGHCTPIPMAGPTRLEIAK